MVSKNTTLLEIAAGVPVTEFVHYRDYLAKLYNISKSQGKYSYNQFAEDLGLPFSNVLWLVVSGKRKLTKLTGEKIASALKLTGTAKKYLFALIAYNNAGDPKTRETLFEELTSICKQSLGSSSTSSHLEYFSQWYYPVIRELTALEDFQSDPQWISNKLNVKVWPREIKKALELLESLGLIHFDRRKNRYVPSTDQILPDRNVEQMAAIRHHQKMCELARDSAAAVAPSERELNSLTVSLSPEAFAKLRDKLLTLCQEIMELERSDASQKTGVYQINLQAFSLVKKDEKG